MLYRMKYYEDGKTYINLKLISSIISPESSFLYLAISEHYVHDFPHKSKEDALNTFNDIVRLLGVKE